MSAPPPMDIPTLEDLARRIRIRMISMAGKARCGHLGGSLSAADVVTALYFRFLRIDPRDPRGEDRDRFVLSKGHATPLYYSVLTERGFFPESWLDTYGRAGTRLQGHPDMSRTPGVDMTTGSLGQGLSAAVGMAIAGRLLGRAFRVWALIGDGEFQEGQVWEALMCAGSRRLDNLFCVMDRNGLQLASRVDEAVPIDPVAEKWRAFGWHALEIDGHDMADVVRGIGEALEHRGSPVAIIARTVKGKGVSFMENVVKWHSWPLSRPEVLAALRELGASAEEIRPWQ